MSPGRFGDESLTISTATVFPRVDVGLSVFFVSSYRRTRGWQALELQYGVGAILTATGPFLVYIALVC